ncbi:hypothetical protein [Nocardioides sp.]|uniref:hypothetical protein n=1 Tax=Nocardioides sp. TaxID=35761 RepID=UPI00271F5264|nr:hypothetical protein [Nocardioides sp.]MDO9455771.1 hypothetical protein [Nocardioides sp.]
METHTPRLVRLSTALLLGAGVLVIGSTTGATAGALVTGAQIKDGTITTRDVKDGTLAVKDVSPAARKALAGARGPAGPQGPAGSAAAAGSVFYSYDHPGTVLDANSYVDVATLTQGDDFTGPITGSGQTRVVVQGTLDLRETGPGTSANVYCAIDLPGVGQYGDLVERGLGASEKGQLTVSAVATFDLSQGPVSPVLSCAENTVGSATLDDVFLTVSTAPVP